MKKLLLVMAIVGLLMVPSGMRANSITPNFIGVVEDVDGTWLWTYGLTLSANATAVSADDYEPGSPPPVPGSAMFQFFDFWGAIDFFGGASGTGGDFNDVDTSDLDATTGGTWVSVIDTSGLLELGAESCAVFGNTNCPTDDAGPEVLIAYSVGDPIVGALFLGEIIIRSIFGPDRVPATEREAFQSQDCVPDLGECDGSDDPEIVTQANFGPYRPPQPSPIPEPASLLLLGTGLLGLGSRLRKKSKKNNPTI